MTEFPYTEGRKKEGCTMVPDGKLQHPEKKPLR